VEERVVDIETVSFFVKTDGEVVFALVAFVDKSDGE